MHNAALRYCHLEGSYDLLDIEPADLEREVQQLKLKGYMGFNVTIPHKDAIFRMASAHTKEAAQAQASNTVKFLTDGSMLAHNTDIEGFKEALDELITFQEGDAACVIGTGGAARAALLALSDFGFKTISILSRDAARASAFAQSMSSVLPEETKLIPAHWNDFTATRQGVIVNSTPMGQNAVPVADWMDTFLSKLADDVLFFDMVYSRTNSDTPLVALAKSKGLQAVDGAEMLIRQAHKAFLFWTGESPPVEIFRTAFEQCKTP
jgi:shikimate dehydrogenase